MNPRGAAGGIVVSGLSRRFGPVTALDRVTLEVAPGDSLALFGPNGAGKTTLIRVLTLGLKPTSGSFAIGGLDPRSEDLEIRRIVGVISHQSFLYDQLTPRQNLEFFGRLYGVARPRERADELLERLELLHRGDDPVGTLSRGMQQRVSLARALVHDPPVVLLDEPFSGLDPHAAGLLRTTLSSLRQQGRTLLLASHDLARGLELCSRWAVLLRGRIAHHGRSSETDRASLEREFFTAPAAAAPGGATR